MMTRNKLRPEIQILKNGFENKTKSVSSLVKESGVCESMWYQVIRGDKIPTTGRADAMAKALNVTLVLGIPLAKGKRQ